MLRSCITCRAGASPDLKLQYCGVCQSALYCSKACQGEDWKKLHKKICKFINVGHGDMQGMKRFFKLFQESTLEGSRSAALEMKKIAEGQTKFNQKGILFHSLRFLVRSFNSEMLSWTNSPLLVMLQVVDPNVLNGDEVAPLQEGAIRFTPLHLLAFLADPFDYSTHENQLILAKQLIEDGANVNAQSFPPELTPLQVACSSGNVTNLDFVELLIVKGADPNARQHLGTTPLMCSIPFAPGAAKFLLNWWPTTDMRSEESFLTMVRRHIKLLSSQLALPDNPKQLQPQFLLQQWRDIEEMLVERGAHDTVTTNVE